MVALHLLKWVSFQEDALGREVGLRYFRDVDGREVDFVILTEGMPTIFIECKLSGGSPGKGLHYLKTRFPACRAVQINAAGDKDFVTPDEIRVMPATRFLAELV